MSEYKKCGTTPVAQLVERPPRVWEVVGSSLSQDIRGVKFLKLSLALLSLLNNLDGKNCEIAQKCSDFSLALHQFLLARASRRVDFYTPDMH